MKSAILVIDLQVGLFDVPGEPFDYQRTIARINKITDSARKNKIPVIIIQHEQDEGLLEYNSPGWSLVEDLQTESKDYIIRKTTPNSFLRTNLNEILKNEKIDNLIICGYATEFCIDSTVRGAAALGYSIDIVSNGHTTHDKSHAQAELIIQHHNETLSNIKSFGVNITAIKSNEILGKIG